jgi:hypothetical protein
MWVGVPCLPLGVELPLPRSLLAPVLHGIGNGLSSVESVECPSLPVLSFSPRLDQSQVRELDWNPLPANEMKRPQVPLPPII